MIAKKFPMIFTTNPIYQHVVGLLKDSASFVTHKQSVSVPVILVNVLLKAFNNHTVWPDIFLTIYFEDAFAERVWVDHEASQLFVENLLTVFPHRRSAIKEEMPPSDRIQNRYPNDATKEVVLDVILQFWKSVIGTIVPPSHNSINNLLRILIVAVSYPEVRMKASEYLEEWLNNASTVRYAKELLNQVVLYCTESSQEDYTTLTNILKLKSKQISPQQFSEILGQLMKNNSFYPVIALRHFIYTEMLPGKTSLNLKLLVTVYKAIPSKAEEELATIFHDLAGSDSFRVSRSLFRRLAIIFNYDLDFVGISKGLMQERQLMTTSEENLKISWITNLVDLICFLQLQSIPQALYDPSMINPNQTVPDFRPGIAEIQMEAMLWFHMIVPNCLSHSNLYAQLLRRILFMDPIQNYFPGENIGDSENRMYQLLTSAIPVYEDTLTRIVIISLTKLSLTSVEALEILDYLVQRAASIDPKKPVENSLKIQNHQLVEAILQLSQYSVPPTINVPPEQIENFPTFSVTEWMWKASVLLVVIVAFNPATIAPFVSSIATLKPLLAMLITRNFNFPTYDTAEDLAFFQEERDQILAFETIIAQVARPTEAVKIDETNSILLPLIMRYDTPGPVHPIPEPLLQKLKFLDQQFHLGHRLSSQSPHLILSIMEERGPSSAMGWLGPIIQSEPEILESLPIICLCEALIYLADTRPLPMELITKLHHRLQGYRNIVGCGTKPLQEILTYFFNRLSSLKKRDRDKARAALNIFMARDPEEISGNEANSKNVWLERIEKLLKPSEEVKDIKEVKYLVSTHLMRSLQRETHPSTISSYIQYLYKDTPQPLGVLAIAMTISRLAIERPLIFPALLDSTDVYLLMLKIFTKTLSVLPSIPKDVVTTEFDLQPTDVTSIGGVQGPAVLLQGLALTLSHVPKDPTADTDMSRTLATQLREKLFPQANSQLETSTDVSKRLSFVMCRSRDMKLVQLGVESLTPIDWIYLIDELGISHENFIFILKKLENLPSARLAETMKRSQTAVLKIRNFLNSEKSLEFPNVASHLPPPENPVKFQRSHNVPMDVTPPSTSNSEFNSKFIEISLKTIFLEPVADDCIFDKLIGSLLRFSLNDAPQTVSRVMSNLNSEILKRRIGYTLPLLSWLRKFLPQDSNFILKKMESAQVETSTSTWPDLQDEFKLEEFHEFSSKHPQLIEHTLHKYLQKNHDTEANIRRLFSVLKIEQDANSNLGTLGLLMDAFSSLHPSFNLENCREWGELLGILNSCPERNLGNSLRISLLQGPRKPLRVFANWLLSLPFLEIRPREWLGWVRPLIRSGKIQVENSTSIKIPESSMTTLIESLIVVMKDKREWDAALDLLLQACEISEFNLKKAMTFLTAANSDPAGNPAVGFLLSGLYLKFPTVVSNISLQLDLSNSQSSQISSIDRVMHAGVRALMDPSGSVSNRGYQLLRDVSIHHPNFMLKYVPTLASLLEGRGNVGTSEFLERQYPRLFIHVLALLDSLRPKIFQIEGLKPMMLSFILVLNSINTFEKDLVPLISKMINFLCYFAVTQPDSTLFNSQLEDILKHLGTLYPEIKKIGFLEQILHRKVHESELAIPFPPNELGNVKFNLKVSKMTHDMMPKLLATLRELDQASLRTPAVLVYFLDEAIAIIQSCHATIGHVAFSLILRYLHHAPRDGSKVIESYLNLIEDEKTREIAMEYAPEFFNFADDHSELILRKIFKLGRTGSPLLHKIFSGRFLGN
eukprot:TRINITY_DN3254_c0_g1_i1.p1 TRINITY_DN3254_c0_g1~~TRINITY_DN3254_c0_g1_i1.p1  ORF type:complete len:1741 (+),score=643.50 TRINITY_DN3254_c0_g1_i1:485-5707(+)